MSVRYTDAEKLILKRANEAIADPATSDWHRRRFEGDIKRVREAAEARAKEREARNRVPPPPMGVSAESHAENRQRVKEFLAKLRGHLDSCAGCPQCHGGARVVESGAVTAKPKAADTAPPADPLAGVESYTICEKCLVSTEWCGCGKRLPGIEPMLNALDGLEELERKRAADEAQQ